MNAFALANPGLENISAKEILELLKTKAQVDHSLIKFSAKGPEDFLLLFRKGQSFKRLAFSLGRFSDLEKLGLEETSFNWPDCFCPGIKIKVEVENVPGNENRVKIAKKVLSQFFPLLEKNKIIPEIDLRNPDLVILVYSAGENYYLGLDLCGKELNSRSYRIFAGHSSFKGDHAYCLVRKSGFGPGENLLVCYAKDGAVAIEAALFANQLNIRNADEAQNSSFVKWPMFKEADFKTIFTERPAKKVTKISAVDESQQNIIAAKKNSALAGTKEVLEFSKYSLDELDVKFSEGQFDRIICYITNKDEDKINEIYYQFSYLLKPKGTLLLITRKNFDLSVSSRFVLKGEEDFVRGDSCQKIWVMEGK